MQALQFDRTGSPVEVLQLRDIPKPTPSAGEVLVRMLAAPINPSDLMYIRGEYGLKPTLPATPGFEGVGIVEASGGGMLGRFLRGKRVVVMNDRTGNWSEYTTAKAKQCIPVPGDFTDKQAATFFVNPATALALTRHVLKVPAGEWLLQTAANSALAHMVIRLGKQHGFRTLNVVRRKEQVESLKAIGADEVIVNGDGPLPEQVRRIVGENGLRYAIDPVGGETGTNVVQSLAKGGRLVVFGSLSGEPMQVDARSLITNDVTVQGFWLTHWIRSQPLMKKLKFIHEIRRLIREGVLHTEIAESFPLANMSEAMAKATEPGRTGKVLWKIADSARA